MDRRQIIQDLTVYMNDVVARHVPKSGIIFMVDSGHDISVLVGSEYLCSYSLEYMIWAVDFSREESVLEYVYDLTATKQADMSDTIVPISVIEAQKIFLDPFSLRCCVEL